MNSDLIKYLENKEIVILGIGLEGQSSYNYLRKYFPEKKIIIADSKSEVRDLPLLGKDKNIEFILGENYLDVLNHTFLIIKSPGISLKSIEKNFQAEIVSQTELFLRYFGRQVIGITGTKGKSTTTSLIYHLLNSLGTKAELVGNIGIPPLDIIENISPETYVVYELSSHQLERVTHSPHIAVLLNIYEEHLDYYNSYREYQDAKFRIAIYQNNTDKFVYNFDSEVIQNRWNDFEFKGNLIPFSLSRSSDTGCFVVKDILFYKDAEVEKLFEKNEFKSLKGDHNLMNIMAAIDVVKLIVDATSKDLLQAINSFKPLEHRMEFVGKYNGVLFYNDSISTIPEATIAACHSISDVDTLILGGMDRGIDYRKLISFIAESSINTIIFIGNAGERMYDLFYAQNKKTEKILFCFDDFTMGVEKAKQLTAANKVCLLSPAAASYGMFKNFEERGKVFKQLVSSNV